MFSLGVTVAAADTDAESPNKVVILDGMATLSEICILCRTLYTGCVFSVSLTYCGKGSIELSWAVNTKNVTLSEINDLLEVSRRWTFDTVYTRALELLEALPLEPATRIYYGRHLDLDREQWILAPARQLARTLRPITTEQAERLGYKVAYKVLQAQDFVRSYRIGRLQYASQTGCCSSCMSDNLSPVLPSVILLLTRPLPMTVSPDDHVDWLRRSLISAAPGIRSFTHAGCGEKWPTVYHVAGWLNWSTEGERINAIINDL